MTRVPLRVVVLGLGMVGARLVDELDRRDPDGALDVTVLGAEGYEPYNRVLLSDVVAGRTDVAAIGMPLPSGRARVLRGVTAVGIDREARTVLADDGSVHPYDRLVIATGSTARIPDLPGLEPLPAGVHPLRTLDDAREIVAATLNATRAVVVGGGVLGVEAALGLASRGVQTVLVHGASTPMDRQLDASAGDVLARALADRGVRVVTGERPREALVVGGRVVGVRLGSGEVLAAGLVVLAAGTVPETTLAAAAGFTVNGGIVVGPDLATVEDGAVYAIGDCASPPEGSRGLVAEGWDQARRLAEALCAEAASGPADGGPRPSVHLRAPWEGARASAAMRLGTILATRAATDHGVEVRGTDVVKVKAGDLSVVAMGACGAGRTPRPGERSVRLSDPVAGRWVEAVVADGVLVGATCVGDARVAADLAATYTRRTPVPADPAFLLLTSVAPAAAPTASPAHMPDDAVVCRCNAVTKADVAAAVHDGACDVAGVAAATRATTGCGGCKDAVEGLCGWLAALDRTPEGDEAASPERTRETDREPSGAV